MARPANLINALYREGSFRELCRFQRVLNAGTLERYRRSASSFPITRLIFSSVARKDRQISISSRIAPSGARGTFKKEKENAGLLILPLRLHEYLDHDAIALLFSSFSLRFLLIRLGMWFRRLGPISLRLIIQAYIILVLVLPDGLLWSRHCCPALEEPLSLVFQGAYRVAHLAFAALQHAPDMRV
jgi:hypothetical protein